ncbi:hypothetical protein [Selenomonas ruminantium]|uniref:Uncharacterized protein n=1 Tax=Selenomonas ruminantium TaxID=971 RepID=A0A1I0YB73_SELRU|nr:hypothetical protein [Selenomonas ruminantium]SFB10589.1 hypothetical protein SAMN05216587_11180 [Selenomonas ruminantium]
MALEDILYEIEGLSELACGMAALHEGSHTCKAMRILGGRLDNLAKQLEGMVDFGNGKVME